MKNEEQAGDSEKGDKNIGRKMKGDDLVGRLLDFSVRIIKLANSLPKTSVGKHINIQLVRCGTSPGANYEEARGAESKSDFTHKMGIALKEVLRESRYWIKVISHSEMVPEKRLDRILNETEELCKIVGKSIITAKKKTQKQ